MVLIIAIIAGIFFAFFYMNIIEKLQDIINPILSEANWATTDHYTAFYWAALVVTNIWTYVVAFVFFILGYWAWIYSQRKGAGY